MNLMLASRLSLLILCTAICLVICGRVVAEVTAERTDRGVVVKIDGELFTEYLTKAGHQPALWPVIGPTGKAVTRSYPLGAAG